MKITNSLKVWRARKDVTQEQLAAAVGISRQTVNAIEKGRFVPSVYNALKMARYFETAVEEIFSLAEL